MRPRLTGASPLTAPLRPALHTPPTPIVLLQPAAAASRPFSTTDALHARLIRRPRRPYTFTQLVQLSDGSTYTQRTTSPHALYRSTKDTRNHALWQPSEKALKNVELDEAGKLAAFRERFGRGFDMSSKAVAAAAAVAAEQQGEKRGKRVKRGRREEIATKLEEDKRKAQEAAEEEYDEDDLGDLISGYADPAEPAPKKEPPKPEAGKGKKK